MAVEPGALFAGASVVLAGLALAARCEHRRSFVDRLVQPTPLNPGARPGGSLRWVGGHGPWRRLATEPRLAARIRLAGWDRRPEEVVGARIALAALLPAVLLLGFLPPPRALVAAPLLAAAGFLLPDLVLARRAKRRTEALEAQVPDLVEILAATVAAGLSPAGALRRSVDALGSPLSEELERTAAEIDLGVPWREALDHLVDRTEVPSLRRLAHALTRSARLGTSLRSTLSVVVGDLRAARRARAEERARQAPVHMLFPLVFLILPAFLLLTVGPVVISTLRSLGAP